MDALEAIPADKRTGDIDMKLARAYNNMGNSETLKGRQMLKHALKLMQVHEDELGTTYLWNFHMGYAWYYLDQESRALPHFRRALELNTGDDSRLNSRQGIEDLTDDCEKRIALPRVGQFFRERTETTWEAFAKQESQMRYLMGEGNKHEMGNETDRTVRTHSASGI